MSVDLTEELPPSWRAAMAPYLDTDVIDKVGGFIDDEYAVREVFRPRAELFAALRSVSVRRHPVLILGQDPFHKTGQAHGLSFSVRPGVAIPPSLRNIYKEIAEDLGVAPPPNGDLTGWAAKGVLLLNAVLTVRPGKQASHIGRGWRHVTDSAIRALDALPSRVVFLLWGVYAPQKPCS